MEGVPTTGVGLLSERRWLDSTRVSPESAVRQRGLRDNDMSRGLSHATVKPPVAPVEMEHSSTSVGMMHNHLDQASSRETRLSDFSECLV